MGVAPPQDISSLHLLHDLPREARHAFLSTAGRYGAFRGYEEGFPENLFPAGSRGGQGPSSEELLHLVNEFRPIGLPEVSISLRTVGLRGLVGWQRNNNGEVVRVQRDMC